jgi:hypothetical protein
MAGHARIGKQPRARFAFVEILRACRRQDQPHGNAKGEQDAPARNRSHHGMQDPPFPITG